MCNSGICSYEILSGPNWGDCGKKPDQICPESYETEEETELARCELYQILPGHLLIVLV